MKTKNNSLQRFYEGYAKNSTLMRVLKKAYDFEYMYRAGITLGRGYKLYAKIYDNHNSWQIKFTCRHGIFSVKQIDDTILHIESKNLEEQEIERVINLKSKQEIRDLITDLKLMSFVGREDLIDKFTHSLHLYRRIFQEYTEMNSFLWEETGFGCAYELYNYLTSAFVESE